MEAKYYTPAIEEFHVGFEYYWRNSDGHTQDELIPNTIKSIEQIIDIQNPIYEIKVKALDREDIESLGWTQDFRNTGEEYYFLNGFDLRSWNNNWYTIYEDKGADEYCYRGTIRNKSELKMTMRMIGINR